jgi:lantibiotic modifying enzyme
VQESLALGDCIGELSEVQVLGDRHRGGRAVLLVRFSSGFETVYKPRPISVEKHFAEFLAWINKHSDLPSLKVLHVLDQTRYGWVEYVRHKYCDTRSQIERFYRRQGAYLAILYCLAAVDLHSENVIAAGEHPVLIDLESLFHHDGAWRQSSGSVEHMPGSVLDVGLLPPQTYSRRGADGI